MIAAVFKVIVVGGGPVGITAAHALFHAKIDFIVLERQNSVSEDTGATLVLDPQTLRVYHQLGLLPKIQEIGAGLRYHATGSIGTGNRFRRSGNLELLRRSHGCTLAACHRADLVQVLFNHLPQAAKAKYLFGKKVVDISADSSGVYVTCSDGSAYNGSVVIGADGVRSTTRIAMQRLAMRSDNQLNPDFGSENPFSCDYKCLWASFPRLTGPGESYETQGPNRSVMYLTGRDKGWIFLFEKVPEHSAKGHSYDQTEIASFAESFSDWHVNESFKVRDCFSGQYKSGMSNLEEGILQSVSWNGRIVLIGDACHKFTPNSGLGFNNGVQDVVSLCNQLYALLHDVSDHLDGHAPGADQVQYAFDRYWQERYANAQGDLQHSSDRTRLSAWSTTLNRFLASYVFTNTLVERYWIAPRTTAKIRKGLVLVYLASGEPFDSKVPWDYAIQSSLDTVKKPLDK